MSFEPINTQEEFDAAIKSRIARAEEAAEKKVRAELQADLDNIEGIKSERDSAKAELDKFRKESEEKETKITSLTSQLTEANARVKTYETDSLKLKIAQECGIPVELRGRLTGETEEEIRKDAETFAGFLKAQNNRGLPGFEPGDGANAEDEKRKQLKSVLGKLRKDN